MNNKRLWLILSIAVLSLQVIAEVLTAVMVAQLNVLPAMYMIAMCIVFGLLAATTGLLLFLSIKKPVGMVRRIIACILALLMVCGCALIAKIASDAYEAIHAVTNPGETTNESNIYVLVRADDPAVKLEDTAQYSYAMMEGFEENKVSAAIALVEKATNKTLEMTRYPSASETVDALLNKQADAVILTGVSVVLLTDEEAYEDLMDKVKILHSFSEEDVGGEDPNGPTQPEQVEDVTKTPFVLYISGSDTRNNKLRISRSDVNILVVVNPVTKQILLLNTPRDYYIPNPVGDGALDKLTHCGLYGPSCSMQALGDLYGMKVNYYAQINFTGFETLIDAIGGVTVYSDQAFTARGTTIVKGYNDLNGADALNFARERYQVSGGDNGRGKNQMKVISAVINKMTSGTTIINNYSKILKSLEGMFKTSLDSEEISDLVKMQLGDMASWNVQSFAVTGKGGSEKNYSSPGHKAYVMYPNEAMVAYASQLVDRVLNGETLTAADMKMPTK